MYTSLWCALAYLREDDPSYSNNSFMGKLNLQAAHLHAAQLSAQHTVHAAPPTPASPLCNKQIERRTEEWIESQIFQQSDNK